MLKKLSLLVAVFFTVSVVIAQSGGTIKGKIVDKDNNEPLPFASVVLKKGGSQIAGANTDFDGAFTFPALTPGKYDLEATYVGYQAIKVAGVVVNSGKITFVPEIRASSGAQNIDEFVVVEYKVPLIDKDQTSSGGTVSAEDIKKMPGRSAAAIAATVGGVYSKDDGSTDLNVRGTRAGSTDMYIDGIKVRGSQNLPKSAIEQISVITGGVPAQFGDVTGGIINVTTRGASKEWFGGIEYLTSGFKTGDDVVGFDNFGFNLLGFSLSGPIVTKKDSAGNKKDAIAGFFLSGEFKHEVDPRPYFGGDTKLVDGKIEDLNEIPYIQNLTGLGGVTSRGEFLRESDFESTPFRLNVARKSMNLAGKIDLVTSKTTTFTAGGSFDYRDQIGYSRSNSLLNYDNNGQFINNTWRVYGRFTQRFANSTDEENPSLIKDAYINIQVDYSSEGGKSQSDKHKDNLSHYGYVGKFTTTREIQYSNDIFTPTVELPNGQVVSLDDQFGSLSSEVSTLYSYEPGDLNPVLSNYTTNYYDIYADNPEGNWERIDQLVTGQGLANGFTPQSIYQIYNSMGTPYNSYQNFDRNQFRVSAQGSATIKSHEIKIGFEYEQNVDRSYTVNDPIDLWQYGRQLVNVQRDSRNTIVGTYDSVLVNTDLGLYEYTFQQAYSASDHSTFDKNLRESLGMEEQGLNWIDFDSYGPDVWDIGMFSPDELINGGGYVSTYGYDYEGNKLSGNPSLNDFFNKTDERGDKTREAAAFSPIYAAGFIQDKFAFDDLVFNVGIRVDRYDANQSVLKDKYTLLPIKTVGDVQDLISQANNVYIPSNIGNDFQIYVSDAADPSATSIRGFRDGDTWYNAQGEEIRDPAVLHSTGIPQPWLLDPNKNNVNRDLNEDSFEDYEPQVNISPRIAFSFPISDEALFFAHYDVLTQRPSGGVNRLDLISYLAFNQGGTNVFGNPFNNPNLKPEQTIDYEIGFQQKLDNYSSLKIAAFYKENRDQVQVTQVIGAYPGNYQTYENRDFGTVKGFTLAYDLRTRGNLSLKANYTLQFADGTGSDISTSTSLVQGGFGNLRTLIPLSFDQRHNIQLSADYRYGSGKNYDGPVLFGKDFLQNTGANLIVRAGSGTPYTKRGAVNGSQVLIGNGQGNQPQSGQLNASRLPFATTVDFKIDRTFDVKFGKVKEGEDRKEASLNVYFQILNLLNAQNILSVYSYTGNATDDGFLSFSNQQQYIESQTDSQSYRDLYSAKMDNGARFALPRRIRLGIQLNF
jgi:outer membrane receptor protein involved in Fe transport